VQTVTKIINSLVYKIIQVDGKILFVFYNIS